MYAQDNDNIGLLFLPLASPLWSGYTKKKKKLICKTGLYSKQDKESPSFVSFNTNGEKCNGLWYIRIAVQKHQGRTD